MVAVETRLQCRGSGDVALVSLELRLSGVRVGSETDRSNRARQDGGRAGDPAGALVSLDDSGRVLHGAVPR